MLNLPRPPAIMKKGMGKLAFSAHVTALLFTGLWGCDGEFSKTDADANETGPDMPADRMDTIADPDGAEDADAADGEDVLPDPAGDEPADTALDDIAPGEPDMDLPTDPDVEEAEPDIPLPYPVRSDYRIKAIQPLDHLTFQAVLQDVPPLVPELGLEPGLRQVSCDKRPDLLLGGDRGEVYDKDGR